MQGLQAPDIERWSERVVVVRGLNPGPFTGPGTNTFLVGTGPRPLLIDTGAGAAGYVPLLGRALQEYCSAERPSEVLITHAHGDHIGGAQAVLEHFGECTVHQRPWPERDAPFAVTLSSLKEGDVVQTEGARLRALHCRGHAEDHLCFLLEEEAALFTGDVVLGLGTTVIPLAGGNMRDYLESLRRILGLNLRRIYPGHGPLIEHPSRRVREYLEHRESRESQILAALGRGPESVEGLVGALYSEVPRTLHAADTQALD